MNENCRGHEFERHGRRWGRCMRDAGIFGVSGEGPYPAFCPLCHRPWRASVGLPPSCEFDAEIQIDLPLYKVKMPQLENLVELAREMADTLDPLDHREFCQSLATYDKSLKN